MVWGVSNSHKPLQYQQLTHQLLKNYFNKTIFTQKNFELNAILKINGRLITWRRQVKSNIKDWFASAQQQYLIDKDQQGTRPRVNDDRYKVDDIPVNYPRTHLYSFKLSLHSFMFIYIAFSAS